MKAWKNPDTRYQADTEEAASAEKEEEEKEEEEEEEEGEEEEEEAAFRSRPRGGCRPFRSARRRGHSYRRGRADLVRCTPST